MSTGRSVRTRTASPLAGACLAILAGCAPADRNLPTPTAGASPAPASANAPVGASVDRLLLLVPDDVAHEAAGVQVWLDAGREEGLHVVPVADDDFLRLSPLTCGCAGVIAPDTVHSRAGDALVEHVRSFVQDGGALLLVYDAGTLDRDGRRRPAAAPWSDLAGVDYARFDVHGDDTIRWSPVRASPEDIAPFDIPPGKYAPATGAATPDVELRRYFHGDLRYPGFVTDGQYRGRLLFRSDAGAAAGRRDVGDGVVLFVNLPLGYLKGQTDGLLMHAFLGYFATHVLGLPRLDAVPDGVGGLVLNWHIEARAHLRALADLRSAGVFDSGPFSIHVTAGPDLANEGDGLGVNLADTAGSRTMVQWLMGRGHAIGSHGGWMHDYFGTHAASGPSEGLQRLLALNTDAIAQLAGSSPVEYSAPHGNQPQWSTDWLAAHGYAAYYYTGNTGMGPTQGYRDGVRESRELWAFPVSHLDRAASMEEMADFGYVAADVARWFESMTDFTVGHRTVRLIYAHPPGALRYRDVLVSWLEEAGERRRRGEFRWYTMTALARFLQARARVTWTVEHAPDGHEEEGAPRELTLRAEHPEDLDHFAWHAPDDRFEAPRVMAGQARIVRRADGWSIVAGPGRVLTITLRLRTR